MREKHTEDRAFDFMLELMHAGGEVAADLIRNQLKIFVDDSEALPRIIPDSVTWSFDSDWADTRTPFTGPFAEMAPNGHSLDPLAEELSLPERADEYEIGKVKLQLTRFTMHLECTSEYLFDWDDGADFDAQGFDENVLNATWGQLKFDFGETHVMAAYKTRLELF